MVRDAGSRRRLLKAGAGLLAGFSAGGIGAIGAFGSAGVAAEDARLTRLEPLFSISGARLIQRMDIAGNVVSNGFGAPVPLMFPVAVAASFNDIYIADAGAARLYRYDQAFDAMAVMPEVRVGLATRLQTGADGSIYVLDPFASEILRYTRGGRQLPSMRPRQAASRYTSFTIDPLTGKVYAVDSAHLVIDEIQPLGQIATEYQRLDEAGPIATEGRGLYVGSARCGCVIEWLRGRQGRRFGAGKLRLPLALAIDGPNLYALDGADRSVALVHENGVETLAPATLNMLMPESLAVANGKLLVADGAGRRVTVFRYASRRP